MPFFGFIPSAELLNTIQTAQKTKIQVSRFTHCVIKPH